MQHNIVCIHYLQQYIRSYSPYSDSFTCTYSETAPVTNGMATVTIGGLACGITYAIITGGTLDGDLVGPRSSHGTTIGPCPPLILRTTAAITSDSMIGKVLKLLKDYHSLHS